MGLKLDTKYCPFLNMPAAGHTSPGYPTAKPDRQGRFDLLKLCPYHCAYFCMLSGRKKGEHKLLLRAPATAGHTQGQLFWPTFSSPTGTSPLHRHITRPRPIPSSERNASVVPTQSCLQPLPETPSLSGAQRSKSGSLQLSTQGGQGVREVNCRPGLQRRLAYTDSTARADPALPVTMRFRPFRPCTDEGGGVQLAA